MFSFFRWREWNIDTEEGRAVEDLTCVRHKCVYIDVQSCLTLGYPRYCSPPGSSVHGIFPEGTLEWVAISSSRESSQPRDWTCVSSIADRFFTTDWATWEAPRHKCLEINVRLKLKYENSTLNSAQYCVVACMGGSLGVNGYAYMYDWVPSLFTWNYHNMVNQYISIENKTFF